MLDAFGARFALQCQHEGVGNLVFSRVQRTVTANNLSNRVHPAKHFVALPAGRPNARRSASAVEGVIGIGVASGDILSVKSHQIGSPRVGLKHIAEDPPHPNPNLINL